MTWFKNDLGQKMGPKWLKKLLKIYNFLIKTIDIIIEDFFNFSPSHETLKVCFSILVVENANERSPDLTLPPPLSSIAFSQH